MLEVGNGHLTLAEQRSHFTLWSLIKAPLLLGNDLRNISPEVIEIISNKEVIALNQDPLGVQGYKRTSHSVVINDKDIHYIRTIGPNSNDNIDPDIDDETVEVWAGDLHGGDVAIVLLNRSSQPQQITANFEEFGMTTTSSAKIRDLWAHLDLGIYNGSVSATVGSHDVVALRLTPVSDNVFFQFEKMNSSPTKK
jgi:alpha-galactosidase